jgi:phenolic acid decarboxylase
VVKEGWLSNMPAPVFAGNSYSLQVDNGIELRDQYAGDGRSLHWEAVKGPTKGQSETVDLHVVEVADGVYFVSWLESSGMTISRVMNFKTGETQLFGQCPPRMASVDAAPKCTRGRCGR